MKTRFLAVFLLFPFFAVASLQAESEQASSAGDASASGPVSAAEPQASPFQAMVWLDDELLAGAKTDGNWLWDTATVKSGEKSHGHSSGKGLQSHGFSSNPVNFSTGGMIVQQVWLDPQDPPRGIMLKFKLASGEEVGVYWEGEEEVFTPKEDEQVWYYGLLPELGKWASMEILAEDLGLEGEKLVGVSFITFDGRVLWDKTEIAKAPPLVDIREKDQVPQTVE